MHTITIELPDTLVVTSRGIESVLDTTKLNAALVAQLAIHGAGQKIGDAASGAAGLAVKDKFGDSAKPADHKPFLQSTEGKEAVAKHTQALMDKAREGLERNEWSMRTSGGAVSEEVTVQRIVARAAYKGKLGGASEDWKDFLAMDKADQNAKLDDIWAKNASKLSKAYDAKMKERAEARKALPIDIDL